MNPAARSSVIRYVIAALLCTAAAALPVLVQAAATRGESGVQLLQAYLPLGTTAANANCEQLARAVKSATHARRAAATAILNAALTRGAKVDPAHPDATLACPCVSRLLRTSIGVAPEKAVTLLEVATSLYPSCAESLDAMAKNLDDKNVVDDKNGPANRPPSADQAASPWDPTVRDGDNNLDPDQNLIDPIGFGVGFGPGFPGSPGFTGSPPSGSLALPPIQTVVTSVANG